MRAIRETNWRGKENQIHAFFLKLKENVEFVLKWASESFEKWRKLRSAPKNWSECGGHLRWAATRNVFRNGMMRISGKVYLPNLLVKLKLNLITLQCTEMGYFGRKTILSILSWIFFTFSLQKWDEDTDKNFWEIFR